MWHFLYSQLNEVGRNTIVVKVWSWKASIQLHSIYLLDVPLLETQSTSIESWKQFCHPSWYFFFLVSQSRLLPNKMSVLPGSSLTMGQSLDALALIHIKLSNVVQTSLYYSLATVWPTTAQLGLLNMDLVHILDTTIILSLLSGSGILSCRVMCPYWMSSCVGH